MIIIESNKNSLKLIGHFIFKHPNMQACLIRMAFYKLKSVNYAVKDTSNITILNSKI